MNSYLDYLSKISNLKEKNADYAKIKVFILSIISA